MLKSKIEKVLEDGTPDGDREIMILEEGETIESVRNPEKRKEALDLVDLLKVEFDANCTPRVPGTPGILGKIVKKYKQDPKTFVYRYVGSDDTSIPSDDPGIPAVLTEKYTAMRAQFFHLLLDHFLPTCPPTQEEHIAEIRQLLREGIDTIDVDTCYNSTFFVLAVHKALKKNNLPMIDCVIWTEFARNYTVLMMSK